MNKPSLIFYGLLIFFISVPSSALATTESTGMGDSGAYEGPALGLPHYSVTDEHLINVASGAISHSIQTVSIGQGQHGLAHSISVINNDLVNYHQSQAPGYKDKFRGGIITQKFSEKTVSGAPDGGAYGDTTYIYYTTHVFDHEGSYDFDLDASTNTFSSIRDDQVTLVYQGNGQYLLTKADGTKVYFRGYFKPNAEGHIKTYAVMVKIVKPDGFTIDIHKRHNSIFSPIMSVNTNNGLQLKYIYDVHHRPIAADKRDNPHMAQMPSESGSWSSAFPSKIVALNNAVEVCPIQNNTCQLSHDWPTATFEWPDGMPRAMYVGQDTFTVTDMGGLKTVFHTSQAAHPLYPNESRSVISKITLPNEQSITYRYSLSPILQTFPAGSMQYPYVKDYILGVLGSATKDGRTTEYRVGPNTAAKDAYSGETIATTTNVDRGVERIYFSNVLTAQSHSPKSHWGKVITVPYYIETWDKIIHLTKDATNRVTEIEDKLTDHYSLFEYDNKGRLYQSTVNDAVTQAQFNTYMCNSVNCNKPSATSSPYSTFLGYDRDEPAPVWTYTKYSHQTGQLISITHPQNASNINPMSVYKYTLLSARYKNAAGSIVNATTPISMLTRAISCENSAMVSERCQGNDQITIDYHYGTGSGANNLWLIASTYSSQRERSSFVTCYEHDKYGRVIGESQPKSGISVSACNTKRGF